MARLDVYRHAETGVLLLDCQSDFVDIGSRLVAPLLASDAALDVRLNPVLMVEGERYAFAPQFIAAVPIVELKQKIASVTDDDYRIARALDLVLGGV